MSGGNLSLARTAAINRAKQQALLQAGAYLSSRQQIKGGVLTVDEFSVQTEGRIGSVEILQETINGNQLTVHIRAKVFNDTACSNGQTGSKYRKRVAITAFPLLQPTHANLGQLQDIESGLATTLVAKLQSYPSVTPLNAGNLILQPPATTATTQLLPRGSLTTMLDHTQQMDAHYVVSGLIRDMSMQSPQTLREKNLFVDLYNKLDYRSSKHLRVFAVDLYIHDGFTGSLIGQRSFATAGRWEHNAHQAIGFSNAAFWQDEFGQRVAEQVDAMAEEINTTLRCQPFTAIITRADDYNIWFRAGAASGIKPGDKFDVFRKSEFFNQGHTPTTELTKTKLVLTVEEILGNTTRGRVNGLTGQSNIQPADVIMSR